MNDLRDAIARIHDAMTRGRRFLAHDIWRIGMPGEQIPDGFIIAQIRVLILLGQSMVKDALLLRAAALTFTTMLSLVPMLAAIFYIVHVFEFEEDVYRFIAEQVFQDVAQVADAPPPDGPLAHAPLADAPPPASSPADPDAEPAPAYIDPVEYLIEFGRRGSSPRALGLWGVIFVVGAVFGLMSNIESSFNRIWGITRSRSYYRMLTDYLFLLILLPVVAFGMLSATAIPPMLGISQQGLAAAIGAGKLILVCLAFSALYFFVPNTHVHFRYALLGGIVAGALWSLASWGYIRFQLGLANYTLLYSTFAQFPVLLMWIYVSWIILLFGAELAFAYQNVKTYAMERLAESASYAYREATAIRAMLEIARRFDAGLPGFVADEAAERWPVPTRLLNDTLAHLEDAALVRRSGADPVEFLPARPLQRITLGDVVHALRSYGRDPSPLQDDDAFRALIEIAARHDADLYDQSLDQLLRDDRIAAILPDPA